MRIRTLSALLAALGLSLGLIIISTPANAVAPSVVINEVESNGDAAGDWIEFFNTGAEPVDLSGYIVKDNDDTHAIALPSGTTIAAGGYFTLVTDAKSQVGSYGLGAADSARLFAPDGTTLIDSHSWTAHAAVTYGRCPNGTGAFRDNSTSTRGATNDCTPPVRINEVESNGDSTGDWIELYNTSNAAIDLSGYTVKDNDDTHAIVLPAGTSIPAGGYYVVITDDKATVGNFGLGAADSARLFAPDATLVDNYTWTAHAAITYGRCPNGTGAFANTAASTRGAANVCAGDIIASAWPGGASVNTVDPSGFFGTNLSGLAYQSSGATAPGTLWAVKNGPGTLYKLTKQGTGWAPAPGEWAAGKALRYTDGTGDPDAEGVTLANGDPANGLFVSTERNNANSGVSKNVVLRVDPATGTATKEWDLTSSIPATGANLGLEAIAWVPDSYLTAKGFIDDNTGKAYDPAGYPNHTGGLFFVGVEATGAVHAFALTQDGGATRIATAASGFTGVMDLEWDPERQSLWAVCDDTCNGRSTELSVNASGKLAPTTYYERPAGMPNINNEGFAIAPQAECVNGSKPAFWSDDNGTGGFSLREGTINCTAIPEPVKSATTTTAVTDGFLVFARSPWSVKVSLTAADGSAVNGPVTVSENGVVIGSGTATNGAVTINPTPYGKQAWFFTGHPLTISYAGDSTHQPSSTSIAAVVFDLFWWWPF